MSKGGVTPVVRAAEKRNVGRGIARLPKAARRALGMLNDETVVIEDSRETIAKMWPTRPGAAADEMLVNADTRANAGVKVGDNVRVRKIAVRDVRSVTFAGLSAFERTSVDRRTVGKVVKVELRNRPAREGDHVRVERLGEAALAVSETTPEGVARVTDAATVSVMAADLKDASKAIYDAIRSMTDSGDGDSDRSRGRAMSAIYEDIDGLDDKFGFIREMIGLPLFKPEVFTHLDIKPPKGVPLHDLPGTGKTLTTKAVVNEVDASFTTISGLEMFLKYKGESEEKLREVFQSAREDAPATVFFNEIDSIVPKCDDGDDLEDCVTGQLLSLTGGLDAHGDVVVIDTTNRVDGLSPVLRRDDRFDRGIETGVPNEAGHREILGVHTRRMPLAKGVDINRLAPRTHGFAGADPEPLAKEAAITALRRVRRESGSGSRNGGGKVIVADMTTTRADFKPAMATIESSAMREHIAERPTEGFEGVDSFDDVKRTLERVMTWPLTYAPLFEAVSTDPPTGLLLHGPPGIGKMTLVRVITAESGVNFIHVASPEPLDRYVGESEKSVRGVFDRVRQVVPSIIFFDEIDTITTDHDSADSNSGISERVASRLLMEVDNAVNNPNPVVLAVTNRRNTFDPMLLRSGRPKTHVEVPAPDIETRHVIPDMHVRDRPLGTNIDLGDAATHMDSYTGADVAAACHEVALRVIQDVANAYDGTEANEYADEVCITRAYFDVALEPISSTWV